MGFLRDRPIRQKLVLIIMLVTGGALVLASAGIIVSDLLRSRADLTRDLETIAEIVASNSTAALSFDQAPDVMDTLRSLTAKRSIVTAAVYDEHDALFAQYRREGRARPLPESPGEGERFGNDSLALFRPILLDGKEIGTVYLESDLSEIEESVAAQTVTVLSVLVVSALLALLLSSGLQRLISGPILELAETARTVSERRDYAIRARKNSADELGHLVEAFNDMLSQIQQRDSELQSAKADLENRVEERTLALRQELVERHRAERELAQTNVELEQSNKELDDFAYIASHDLKEPLRGIHNYSVFLMEDYADKLDADGRAKLETLTRLTRRMEALIDSLLHFSRVGRVDLAVDQVDLNEIVAEVLDSIDINLKESKIEVRIPRPLPTVRADRARVGEIFQNLITNAMKYNDKAEKWIEVGCQEGAGSPVFYVRDNGIGIPQKHIDSVFRIFKRLHAREKFGGGTGAGLTIAKKIVERHNGRIWVESTQGEGTTFYFTLEQGA